MIGLTSFGSDRSIQPGTTVHTATYGVAGNKYVMPVRWHRRMQPTTTFGPVPGSFELVLYNSIGVDGASGDSW